MKESKYKCFNAWDNGAQFKIWHDEQVQFYIHSPTQDLSLLAFLRISNVTHKLFSPNSVFL